MATIATVAAYVAMVGFSIDVVGMPAVQAYAFGGVFEGGLITAALLAREASQQGRPAGLVLGLTWLFSMGSGTLAAWHEVHEGHALAAAVLRFSIPLIAALMWHLALVGDRHLAAGMSWGELRQSVQIHAVINSTARWYRAQGAVASRSTIWRRRAADRANRARLRAQTRALRSVPAAELRARLEHWNDAVAAMQGTTGAVGEAVVQDAAQASGVVAQLTQIMTQGPAQAHAAQTTHATQTTHVPQMTHAADTTHTTQAPELRDAAGDVAAAQRSHGAAQPLTQACDGALVGGGAVSRKVHATTDLPGQTQIAASRSEEAVAAGVRDVITQDDAAAASRSDNAAQPATQMAQETDAAQTTQRVTHESTQRAGRRATDPTRRPAPRARTQRVARSKVDLVEVHRMRAAGASFREIGEAFEVSADTVRRAWNEASAAPETPAHGIRLVPSMAGE